MLNLCMEMQRISARRVASRRVRFDDRPMHAPRLLRMLFCGLGCGLALGLSGVVTAQSQAPANPPRHAIAMHGEPAFPANFTHMPYTNPDAPKGGRQVHGVLGTFDSLNPMIVRGVTLPQIRGHVVESLMARGNDEPFTLYGLLAESVETDDARSYVTFRINPKARFSDGKPVTAEDVLFSRELLRTKGRPNHRLYYSKIVKAEALDQRTVRFDITGANDRELPLILGLMPILPKHAIDEATFEETSMTPLIGTGPYRIGPIKPGSSIVLERNPDYWGRDLPINRGLWNFDEIRFEFFRDANSAFEAFKRGLYDFRLENEPLRWSSGYDFPAVQSGQVVQELIANGSPQPSDFLVFNTRRPQFADVRVREALLLLFDFEWINQNYFFNLYQRSGSYFAGSDLSAYGVPANDRERALLQPFPGAVRADIMDGTFKLPAGDISGRDRETLRRTLSLLAQAGYEVSNGVLRSKATGQPFTFEIMTTSRDQERIALAYTRDLKRAGITASVRVVDAMQFDQRRLGYEFDMIQNRWDQSLSPGNEQAFYFGSQAADNQGTRNYMGVKSAAVDAMIAAMLETRERSDFVAAVRALDRVLMSGFYVVPVFSVPNQWLGRWTHVDRPKRSALIGNLPETWWQAPGARRE
jgi:peptide/nickel transport system substrate-binding protein